MFCYLSVSTCESCMVLPLTLTCGSAEAKISATIDCTSTYLAEVLESDKTQKSTEQVVHP